MDRKAIIGGAAASFVVVALLAQLLIAPPASLAGQRRILIHGQAARPMPAIFEIDYPLTRAEAWLMALEDTKRFLPEAVNQRMRQLGYDPVLATLALCALAFPVDVVTPNRDDQAKIRVFLQMPPNLRQDLRDISADPWLLARGMLIVWETMRAVDALRQNWPATLELAAPKMHILEKYKNILDSLWEAAQVMRQSAGERVEAFSATFPAPDSAAILLDLARESGELSLADRAARLLLEKEADPQGWPQEGLWNRLLAEALYLRGRAHSRLGQSALAETDFTSALARMRKENIQGNLARTILLERARLRKNRNNVAGMCEDYAAACALGDCGRLSISRQAGLCLEIP